MTSAEIRQSFLDFFREKEHTIVPSSSLLPDSPNLLFTNAGMNQFVPIFLGQQTPPYEPPRAADTQKCIRAGGKHNDLDDVGLDTYHHTFFEMLGNWSFGDYFKKEAIEWAWELVVRRWGLPPERLYATVYRPGPNEPSEFDQEAHDHWKVLFEKAGLDPAVHIVNGNKADNFWMMGDTGPCGPCSELHVDLTPAGDTRAALVNAGDSRCVEIWNLVFIQFNANPDGSFTPLPAKHVDTGMGFERVTAMMQGTKNFTDFSNPISNYETDIFRPIFDEIEKLSGMRYGSTLPEAGSTGDHDQGKIDVAFRVVADHIRTLNFAIADGILPSNENRGYVLRRILRRAVRYGRSLGLREPFFYKLVDTLAATMGDVFPRLRLRQQLVHDTLKREEEMFNKTLDKGIELFDTHLFWQVADSVQMSTAGGSVGLRFKNFESSPVGATEWIDLTGNFTEQLKPRGIRLSPIDGEFAFKLYDTYGFPLDLTQLMARERGLTVDAAGFEKLMNEQRGRARAARKKQVIELSQIETKEPTHFLGYEHNQTGADVQEIITLKDKTALVLNNSVCYAEMGGQVGDAGELIGSGNLWRVLDTQKSGNTFLHFIEGEEAPAIGEHVTLQYDAPRRAAIERHHTVTHLLHWALHEVVSREAVQKGSYVGPEKLTFDFSSAALTDQQLQDIEKLVNERIAENAAVSWTEVPHAEAKKRSDIQQFFGDKYGDVVRVVQIGGRPNELNGYSMELCGGTHVRATADIRGFKILSDSAIAAGIRRIEAVAGTALSDWAEAEAVRQDEKFLALTKRKNDLAPLPWFIGRSPAAMSASIDARAAHLEKSEQTLREWEKENAKAAGAQLQKRAAALAQDLASSLGDAKFVAIEIPRADGALLQAVVDAMKAQFSGPIFLAGSRDGQVDLVAAVPSSLTAQFSAGALMQEIAPIVGGRGGGRPESARGAGKEVARISEALARVRAIFAAE